MHLSDCVSDSCANPALSKLLLQVELGTVELTALVYLVGNAFVAFKVLFQCKRYVGGVGSPMVRDFRGAMQGRANKGIILTTGSFSSDALKESVRDGVPPISW